MYGNKLTWKQRIFVGVLWLGFLAASAYATERAANAYKATKLNRTAILFSCEDEREPVIHKFDYATSVVISCETK